MRLAAESEGEVYALRGSSISLPRGERAGVGLFSHALEKSEVPNAAAVTWVRLPDRRREGVSRLAAEDAV